MATETHSLMEQMFKALRAGDEAQAVTLVGEALRRGVGALELSEGVIAPALARVGAEWAEGRLSVAHEHWATQTCVRCVHGFRSEVVRATPLGLRAVVACLPGEAHDLGGRIFSELLYLQGWEVHFLGANTPAEDLLAYVDPQRAPMAPVKPVDLLVLAGKGLAEASGRRELASLLAAVQGLAPRPAVLVGGQVATWVEAQGADGQAVSFSEGLRFACQVSEERAERTSLPEHLAGIGKRLHQLRRQRGWSQAALAEASQLDRTYISALERGKQNPTLGALVRVAEALGCSLSDVVLGPQGH